MATLSPAGRFRLVSHEANNDDDQCPQRMIHLELILQHAGPEANVRDRRPDAMTPLLLGIVLWSLLAATGWRYSTIHPTLHRYDRIGALVFFVVIGLPAFICGLALIARSAIA
jgi:hypothetical protein